MPKKVARYVLPLLGLGTLVLVRCVGDSVSPIDAGNDATTNDARAQDGSANDAAADADADAAPPPPPAPTPDGGVVWFDHFQNGAYAYSGISNITVDKDGAIIGVGAFTGSVNFGTTTLTSVTNGGLDAVVMKINPAGAVEWATSMATSGTTLGNDGFWSLTTDSAGSVYLVGSSASSTFTLGSLDAGTGPAAFVAKLESSGTKWDWVHVYTGAVSVVDVAVHDTNVFVALDFSGTLDYGGGNSVTSAGGQDLFVGALSATDGSVVWGERLGGAGTDGVSGIAVTPTGDVVVAGDFTSTSLGGNGVGTALPISLVGTTQNGFVAKLEASDGKATYAFPFGDSASGGDTAAMGVAYYNGLVAVGGYISGSQVSFGAGSAAGPYGTTAGWDGYVFVYDESKKQTTGATRLTSDQGDLVTGVAFDQWGSIAVTGVYGSYGYGGSTTKGSTNAKLGNAALTNTGVYGQGFIAAKLDPSGNNVVWVHGYVPNTPDGGVGNYTIDHWLYGARVTTDSNGRIYGSGALGTTGVVIGSLGYIAKLSPDQAYYADGFVGAWLP